MTTPHRRPPTPRDSRTASARPHQPGRDAEVARALALRDVMDHAVRVQKEITAIERIGPSRGRQLAIVLLSLAMLAGSAYSWITKPEFIWGVSDAAPPARQDAELRFGIFLLAQRLEAFRAETGHYPAAVGDIGEAVEGVSYRLLSDTAFELQALTGATSIVFSSSQSMDEFLGNSVQAVTHGAP